jgi:Domain of unknown function (DUF4349)
MKRLALLLVPLLLVACQRQAGGPSNAPAPGSYAAKVVEVSPARAAAPQPRKTLAYEHEVAVELSAPQISGRLQQLQDACSAHAEYSCSVLDASLQQDRVVPRGNVRLRVAPAAVEPLVQLAARGGEITTRSTHAEDLAEPVADSEREIAQLTTHRDRLTQLEKDRQLNVTQLIQLSNELSRVQARLDEVNSQHANLQRRIDTELLSIELQPPSSAYGAQQSPIREALSAFGSNLRASVAAVIGFVAAFLPWLLLIVAVMLVLRLLWRGRRRRQLRQAAGR